MIALYLPGIEGAAEVVDALLTAADAVQSGAPDLAARRRGLADAIGDALDALPQPRQPTA
ncbi:MULTISPECIES: hypothetical protein [Streptomycetaceae]|uniref:Uncharacterized protein n=1 Tax=Streptantibioticus cattleyicolor (strain ATCC 35852 / DSM 46488 / JCM 4925 / NBRC 14057 / NRRL 8057) TaxID=1003195 RepID=F8JY57_STREN|nr:MULTISPECIES: hypothetical protein [Streptomycetaceae]AEW94633.1 hypothetical protein SCATT_22620 [Streptantibioticus cattleyicolor NRRL 8057 = DSM 46488]MYS59271.1 hypothetical protein [Streptomyces sp. SID5468]CCB74990.1 protein of unknown function [Streptantibioticus cattleyicolor NRRL 8057 = DSM 46488]